MQAKALERIKDFVDATCADGRVALSDLTPIPQNAKIVWGRTIQPETFARFDANCRLVASMLGSAGEPWREILVDSKKKNTPEHCRLLLGTLTAISDAIESGHLLRVEDLIVADVFVDLIEQAEYLFNRRFERASGVLLRATLESHLRRLCERRNCLPTKEKPTIEDLNHALYKSQEYDSIEMKHITAMAGIGNGCAHAGDPPTTEEIQRLLRDVPEFLARNPL